MKIYSAYNLIIIGSRIRYLMQVQQNSTVQHVQTNMNDLLQDLRDAEFTVTEAFINEFLKRTTDRLSKKHSPGLIGEKISTAFVEEGEALEKTLLSEASTKKFYALPESRYNSIYLLETPNKLLRTGTFQKLSEMAVFDFTSACRCILYGEATAGAFHVLRATEDVLKQYYFKYIKSKRLKSHEQTWGALTYALRKKKINKPSKIILDSLDLVRVAYRNPTQHPQAKYDIQQAQDLLGLCIDLINKMTLAL